MRRCYFLIVCATCLFASCITQSDELDLNKEIRLDMKIAPNGLKFPLGGLEKIYLDSLIKVDEGSIISKTDDGLYGISMSDSIDPIVIDFDNISFEVTPPEMNPVTTSFDEPTPESIEIQRQTNSIALSVEPIDINSINDALPAIKQRENNEQLIIEGLPTELTVPVSVTKIVAGHPVNIEHEEKVQTPPIQPNGTFEDFDVTVHIDTLIELPGGITERLVFDETVTVEGDNYKVPRVVTDVVIPTTTVDCGFVYDGFPTDVERINTIYFGDMNAINPVGQLINFNIDLSDVDVMFIDPYYRVKQLNITFPDDMYIVPDPNYELQRYVVVSDNQFTLSMPDTDSLFVNLLSNRLVDPTKPTSLPVSFYLNRLELNRGVDEGETSRMTFDGEMNFSMLFEIKGQPYLVGEKALDMSMGLDEQLEMNDISVDTKRKQIEIDSDKILSSIDVAGLESITEIREIEFDVNQSSINLSMSDVELGRVSFDDNGGEFYIDLPQEFNFAPYCENEIGEQAGVWDGYVKNRLKLYSSKALGHTTILRVESIDLTGKSIVDEALSFDAEISYGGDIWVASATNMRLDDVNSLSNKQVEINVDGSLAIENAVVVTDVIRSEVNSLSKISIDEVVDEALLMVKELTLSESSAIDVNLKFSGVPSAIESIRFEKLKVEFPKFIALKYRGNDTRVTAQGNTLIINGNVTAAELDDASSGFLIEDIQLERFYFDTPLYTKKVDGENRLVLTEQEVKISGNVCVDKVVVESEDLTDIVVTPSVTFAPIQVLSLTGKVSPAIDPISESVSLGLGDELSFLQSDENRLLLDNPQIMVSLKTNFAIPILLDMTLGSKSSDGSVISEDIRPDNGVVRIAPTDRDGTTKTTVLLFHRNELPAPVSDDTINVRISNLSELMTTIPDLVDFNFVAMTDTSVVEESELHYADLTKDFEIECAYNVSVPLSFDDIELVYTDTIDVNIEDIAEYLLPDDSTIVRFTAKIENALPLGVELTVIPCNENGEELDGMELLSKDIASGNGGVATISDYELVLEAANSRLSQMKSLLLRIKVKSGEGADDIALKGTQYIHLYDMQMELVGGLSLDLSNIMK